VCVQGFWSLKEHWGGVHHEYLVLTFVGQTRVMSVKGVGMMQESDMHENEDEQEEEGGGWLEEVDVPGFDSDSTTLAVENMAEGGLVQVTPRGVRLVDAESLELVTFWEPPQELSISMAATSPTQVRVGVGAKVVYLAVCWGWNGSLVTFLIGCVSQLRLNRCRHVAVLRACCLPTSAACKPCRAVATHVQQTCILTGAQLDHNVHSSAFMSHAYALQATEQEEQVAAEKQCFLPLLTFQLHLQVLLSMGLGQLVYLEVGRGQIKQVVSLQLPAEVSCLNISPPGECSGSRAAHRIAPRILRHGRLQDARQHVLHSLLHLGQALNCCTFVDDRFACTEYAMIGCIPTGKTFNICLS
jgi:hypothetical protein